uniref:Uncharacterized protein n=1 Tax=Panagrolaimus sp. PS1159 TaxID=55785 RepID=A0AC35F2N2_9BILA
MKNIKMFLSKIGFIVFLVFIFGNEKSFAALIPEPTQIIRTQVTTFNYGGFKQVQTIEEISKPFPNDQLTRLRRTVAAQESELFKNDADPFAMPEIETYPVEDLKTLSSTNGNNEDLINQQDPRVQEVDVVGWFE